MTNPIQKMRDRRRAARKGLKGTSTGTSRKAIKARKNAKKVPYVPHDDTLGGPTDKWMLPGSYPIGQGHTAIVKVLGNGNHQKCFRQKWLDGYPWMLESEVRGLKAMCGSYAPAYISNDATSVTMADAGEHLTAENMPDDWDEQIGNIVRTLKKAGIRHNDAIPRNIMVRGGQIKLIDFSMSTIIGQPYHAPWPNKRLLKIVMRDADEVMLRRAVNFLLARQPQWKELSLAIGALGTKLSAGSTTRRGWLYHDVPFQITQTAHRKHTSKRAMAIRSAYDPNGKTGLDLGSSVGGISFSLHKLGATMTGVERDPQALRVANALKAYYGIKSVTFTKGNVNDIPPAPRYDFVCYLSTFMWVLKEEGLAGARQSLKQIGKMTDTLFFETSHGDAMAGGAVIGAGLNDKAKMDALVKECTGLTKMKELYIDKTWNNRRLVMFTK